MPVFAIRKENQLTAENLAILFHSTYERLAPAFGWKTKRGCNVAFEKLPNSNKSLMIATCQTVLSELEKESQKPAHSAINSILEEANILRKEHPSKDCRFFAESVYRELLQTAPNKPNTPLRDFEDCLGEKSGLGVCGYKNKNGSCCLDMCSQ